MARAKAEALELIKQLPDDVTTGRIMEELFFKQQVEKGLQDAAEGQGSHSSRRAWGARSARTEPARTLGFRRLTERSGNPAALLHF